MEREGRRREPGFKKVAPSERGQGEAPLLIDEEGPSGASAQTRKPPAFSKVMFSKWKRKIPPLWHDALPRTPCGYIQIPAEWRQWLKILPPGTDVNALPPEPDPELMSTNLWAPINQLLHTVDHLEEFSDKALSSKSDVARVRSAWTRASGILSNVEINALLQLCRIAMSNLSPLTDKQEHFLVVFIASRMKTRGLKTNVFQLISKLGTSLPEVTASILGDELTSPEEIKAAFSACFGHMGETVMEHFLNSRQRGLEDKPPSGVAIDLLVWRFARSFLNLWEAGNRCKVGTEFNVGDPVKGDMLNSSYCSLYLRMLLGPNSPLNIDQRRHLELLMDTTMVMKDVQMIIAGENAGWRKWLRLFNPNRDCLPGNEWRGRYCPDEFTHDLGKGKGKYVMEPYSFSEGESSSGNETDEESNNDERWLHPRAPKRVASGKMIVSIRLGTSQPPGNT